MPTPLKKRMCKENFNKKCYKRISEEKNRTKKDKIKNLIPVVNLWTSYKQLCNVSKA